MGNILSYEIIFPVEWYTIDPNTLWDLIVVELGALILGGEKFHDSIVTINNLATVLDISHKEILVV